MSYEQALEQMRGETAAVPSFERVRARPRWRSRASSHQWVVAAASMTAALGFGYVVVTEALDATAAPMFWANFSNGPGPAALLPAALLIASAGLVLRRRFAPQMFSRAIWWSGLIVGTLMAHLLRAAEHRQAGTCIALACGVALLGAGRRWLDGSVEDAARGTFRPAAFRGSLTVALVMAFADAHTLAFSGLLQLGVGAAGWTLGGALARAWPTFASAAVMGIAVWGLLRLRTWALLLNLVANFVIAGIALHGYLRLSIPVAGTLAATAVVQAFLPVPILALAAGGEKAERSIFLHHGARLSNLAILVLVVVAGLGMSRTGIHYSGWLSGNYAFRRGVPPYPATHPGHLVGRDLRYYGFRGANFQGANFTDSALDFGNLSGADLTYATFDRTTVEEARFVQANLQHARFSNMTFVSTDLRGADLRGAEFVDVEFLAADLTGAWVEGATFENVTWKNTTCPNRLGSDYDDSCESKLWAPQPGDAALTGRYLPTPATRETLGYDAPGKWAISHLLDRTDEGFEPPYALEFSIDERGRLRLGAAILLNITSSPKPSGMPPADLFISSAGQRVVFAFEPDKLLIATGSSQLEFVRE